MSINDKHTKLKCIGCGCKMPKEDLDATTLKPTWLGMYYGCQLVEWICRECYDKGVQYTK